MHGCNSCLQESPSHFDVMSWTQARVPLVHTNTQYRSNIREIFRGKKTKRHITSHIHVSFIPQFKNHIFCAHPNKSLVYFHQVTLIHIKAGEN